MQFLSYEQNRQRPEDSYGLMGIATVELKGDIHRFVVKQGKDGQGFYVHPFSQKMNDTWFKAHDIDSKAEDDQIKTLIRKEVNASSGKGSSEPAQQSLPPEECPF